MSTQTKIASIDSFLVHPAAGNDTYSQGSGTRVAHSGRLFQMLSGLFDRAPEECKIDVAFRRSDDGSQENACRELLLAHLRQATPASGKAIAERLAGVTGKRSGLGLLFVVCGVGKYGHRIVLARFPADEGVLAEERGGNLAVRFIEKVFMRSAHAYKSAVYTASTLAGGFGRGKVVDKQIDGPREVSHYWVREFLLSELATSSALGTQRLADAMRVAIKEARSEQVRAKLVAATTLIPSHDHRKVSGAQLLAEIGVPDEGIVAVRRAMPRPELMDEHFPLSAEEFVRVAPYRSVELDNGALLLAETGRFDDVFAARRVAEGRMRYSTEGKVVTESIRKVK